MTPKLIANTPFLEDIMIKGENDMLAKKTKHHAELCYTNHKTQRKYQFSCYLDQELNIPEQFKSKLLQHSVDNDVTTDED